MILSPVWTPIGSKFSIEQIITTLSLVSLTTSSSNSFQPIIDSSTCTSEIGLASRPSLSKVLNSSKLYAILPPVPPKVKEGLIMAGKPISLICFNPDS